MVIHRAKMNHKGLFVGLTTLDLLYLVAAYPSPNQKIVALDGTVSAGGPATNAAVTFSYLGNQSTLLGVLGSHPMTQLIRTDLEEYGVNLTDLDPSRSESPPVSSIIITQATGERAVISINATKFKATCQEIPAEIIADFNIVLIDGHQISASKKIAQLAKANNLPIVIDAGSWKPGFAEILPWVDYAVCSANFYPPNCRTTEEVFAYLSTQGIPYIAITHGENPIQYLNQGTFGTIEVPACQAIDTLGAGDIFHGAFCHYILQENFTNALASAAEVATYSCQFFGTRRWMQNNNFFK